MKKFKKIIYSVIFLVVLFVMIFSLNAFFDHASVISELGLKMFFNEPKNSLDIIYMGSSTVKADIMPTRIYEKTGLTGYCAELDSFPVCMFKPLVEQCQKRQNPRLYVIDINNLSYYSEGDLKIDVKFLANAVPDKRDANRYIKELLDENERVNYSISLYRNHYNWQWADFLYKVQTLNVENKVSVIKGWQTFCTTYDGSTDFMDISEDYDYTDPFEQGDEYIQRNYDLFMDFLSYLEENNIKAIFIRTPRFTNDSNINHFRICNYYARVLEERGYIYKDFSRDMSAFSPDDFHDLFHMNVSGAEKFSEILADFFIEHDYCNNVTHTEKIEKEWKEAAEKFNSFVDHLNSLEKNSYIYVSDVAYFAYEKYKYIKYN